MIAEQSRVRLLRLARDLARPTCALSGRAQGVQAFPGTTALTRHEQNVPAGSVRLDERAVARLDAITPAAGTRGFHYRLRRP